VFGWGTQPQSIWTSKLQQLAKHILNGKEEVCNVWDLNIVLGEGGDV